ncbi:MAG TPA: hypothetical protein VMQ60_02975 [Acidobacteriaceae bacterium]|jgi:hypothetical protein|nr:hypothetical protein [Acidobacteriaceae bacterium]
MKRWRIGIVLFAMGVAGQILPAQSAHSTTKPAAPASGAQHSFHDPTYKISFDYPVNWNFARHDHQISTFRLDARSAVRTTLMRAVVSMPENPFPASTFSGAYFYFSVTPHSNDAACARQAAPAAQGKREGESEIAGISFAHGHDEQKSICTVQRDEVYTTLRRGSCYRFDLTINNFCGGEVSGVKDITQQELDQVRGRLEAILGSVQFDAK